MPFEEKDVQFLMKLGFTNSQAKIYLSLVHLGQSCVHNIVKVAQIDRAETYRVISQLEKQGFVQRIIANPFEFKPLSFAELLPVLLLRRKAEFCELEKEAKRLQKKKIGNMQPVQEEYMLLASKTEMVLERMKHASKPVRAVNVVSTLCSCRKSAKVLKGLLWRFIENGAKVTFIVDEPVEESLVPELFKDFESHPDFALRYAPNPVIVPVVIIDGSEVWINTSGNANFIEATHLLSNNPRLIVLAQGYFTYLLNTSTSATALKA
jgi:sugar-specific transcriptional regulator TrmB